MLGCQCLNAGDTGDHVELEDAATGRQNRLQDPNGAVVQRRITPHQKSATLAVGHFLIDQPFEGQLLGKVQVFHTGLVVHLSALALRAVGFNETVGVISDVALANLTAQVDQFVFALALVHEEKHVDLVQRFHRLHRDVVGVAGTDADDQKFFHHCVSSRSVQVKRKRQHPLNRNSMADSGSTSIRLNAAACSV
ncbi:hypothetical protein D3C84_668060 [compost metagenome]